MQSATFSASRPRGAPRGTEGILLPDPGGARRGTCQGSGTPPTFSKKGAPAVHRHPVGAHQGRRTRQRKYKSRNQGKGGRRRKGGSRQTESRRGSQGHRVYLRFQGKQSVATVEGCAPRHRGTWEQPFKPGQGECKGCFKCGSAAGCWQRGRGGLGG